MICSHFSIFEPLETAWYFLPFAFLLLWFALILVSLNHWKQRCREPARLGFVVICSHFSIFEPLETALYLVPEEDVQLWFALILVSLNHWKQRQREHNQKREVVICSHFSIFEPLETASGLWKDYPYMLWFALILVSLNHWKQLFKSKCNVHAVVICSHFSIFEPLETAGYRAKGGSDRLWFALILVSLNHWKQPIFCASLHSTRCDLLSF